MEFNSDRNSVIVIKLLVALTLRELFAIAEVTLGFIISNKKVTVCTNMTQ